MLDIKLLREQPDVLRQNLLDRHVRVFDDLPPGDSEQWASSSIERLQTLDQRYRDLLHEQEQLRQRQNDNAQAMRTVGKLPKADQAAARAPLIEEGRDLRERERQLGLEAGEAQAERDEAWRRMPNLTHADTPRGLSDDDHRELRTVGERRDFAAEGFEPRDHLAVAESLDLIDFASGAKVAGQKFYYLKNEAVLLDMALQRYALDAAVRHGFTLHTTPDLARTEILEGLGFNPRGESTQVYSVADSDLCLVGTAEITLGGMLADTIVEPESLPLLLAGLSHCFRTEAGAAGQESRGLYRVHQFSKVELVSITAEEDSGEELERMTGCAETVLQRLDLPYRVMLLSSGDMGFSAQRTYDLEVWLPGQDAYREISSCSNCGAFQARRMNARYRVAGEKGTRLVHTLNGSGLALGRTLIAVLENYQQADGSIAVPDALRPYLGGQERIGGEA